MTDYRRFWLKNSKEEIYDLQTMVSFMNNPANLGFSKTYTGLRLGDRMLIIDEHADLKQVTGELLFFGDTNAQRYQRYFDFINFIKFKPLTLFYMPPYIEYEEDAYYSGVTITVLDKSEVSRDDSIMHCPINMQMLSHWQTKTRTIEVTSEYSGGKKYPNKFPYSYGGNGFTNISINNPGTEDVGMIIHINGESINPRLVLANSDGTYGICKLNGTFDYAVINSIDTQESLNLIVEGLEAANPLNYQDLSVGSPNNIEVTFLKAKTGVSRLAFTTENTFTGTLVIEYTPIYATV